MAKFTTTDNKFFKNRNLFAEKNQLGENFWEIVDNWSLYGGYVNIGRSLAIYELVKQVIDLPGHVVELGTWNGANLLFMAKVIRLLKPNSLIELYGFDSFEGLQMFQEEDVKAKNTVGSYRGNEEILREVISLYEFNDFVSLIKGNIEETLPQFLDERPELMGTVGKSSDFIIS